MSAGPAVMPWTPPMQTTRMPCPTEWDGVHVQGLLGERVLVYLGAYSGAVIADRLQARRTWLVAPGSARDWDLPGVTVVTAPAEVGVPGQLVLDSARLYWRVPLGPGVYLTCAERLHQAIAATRGAWVLESRMLERR